MIKHITKTLDSTDRSWLFILVSLLAVNLLTGHYNSYDLVRESNDIDGLDYYIQDKTNLHRPNVVTDSVSILVAADYRHSNGYTISYAKSSNTYTITGLDMSTCRKLKKRLLPNYKFSCRTLDKVQVLNTVNVVY